MNIILTESARKLIIGKFGAEILIDCVIEGG